MWSCSVTEKKTLLRQDAGRIHKYTLIDGFVRRLTV